MTNIHHEDPALPELHRLAERYDIEGELGRGGMAIVYLGRERATGRRVALKVIGGRYAADSEVVRRFAREAHTVAAFDHPNIVRTLAIEELGGHALAIVSEYVEGETLRAALRRLGPFPHDRVAQVLRDVAGALAHAHERRIVHRDVKPENVFLEAATGRALLGDFGVARPLDADLYLTDVGGSVGTPTYMSPEQVDGRPVDERSDVYALGLLGWEMLTGRQPWEGGTIYAVLYKQKHEELPSLAETRPDTPAFLAHAIEGALAKEPAMRWRNAAEFLVRLTRPPVGPAIPVMSRESADESGDERYGVTHVAAPRTDEGVDETDYAAAFGSPFRPQSWGQAFATVAGLVAVVVFLLRSVGEFERPVVRMDSALAAERAGTAQPDAVAEGDTGSVTRATEAGRVATLPAAGGAAPAAGPRTPPPAPRRPATTASGPRVAARPAPTPASVAAARTADSAALETDLLCATPGLASQRACLIATIERNDGELTRSYQALIGELRARGDGSREPPDVLSLRAEQRAWLALRDQECRRRGRGREGALWAQQRGACFAELSRERAAELRGRLAGSTGG
jgi:uncharacterized protein YecT (DUF1311 family)